MIWTGLRAALSLRGARQRRRARPRPASTSRFSGTIYGSAESGIIYFPDPDIWNTQEPNWQRWTATAEKYFRDVQDYWFHAYKPESGDIIVDIGAGRGEDVFVFSKAVGPSGRV